MDQFEVLLTGAEISVAFAGFAGIVASFQLRNGGTINRGDMVGLMIIVQTSLLAGLSNGVALALFGFGIEESTVWMITSGFAAIWTTWILYLVQKRLRGTFRKTSTRRFVMLLQILYATFIVGLVLNTFGVVFEHEIGPYLAGFVGAMSLVGLMFLRLMLRPLWRLHREQEAAV